MLQRTSLEESISEIREHTEKEKGPKIWNDSWTSFIDNPKVIVQQIIRKIKIIGNNS